MIQLLMICCLLGLGSAGNNQANTCYVSQSISNPEHKQEIKRIRETLESTVSSLESSLASVNETLQQLLEQDCSIGSFQNPASSCSDIPQGSPSGEYWILTSSLNSSVQVYCDMDRSNCSCNDTGGPWMRVAYLDMTDPSQQCPDGFRLVNRTTAPLRTCGSPEVYTRCLSTIYQTYGVEYSQVCGRITGYQDGTPDGFLSYHRHNFLTIDSDYVDGVILTHGQSPRQHIWTFAAALDEVNWEQHCPCTRAGVTFLGTIPPFIGQDYFCATAVGNAPFQFIFYPDNPLWDGLGCTGINECCEFNTPPWFCKQLPQPTTDDIEMRLCCDQDINDEDVPLELIEIYVR